MLEVEEICAKINLRGQRRGKRWNKTYMYILNRKGGEERERERERERDFVQCNSHEEQYEQ